MAFLGMVGTGQFAEDERPEDWRQGIMYEFPNGVAPLTAILSMMRSGETLTDYHFHWWSKRFPNETADVTGIYTDITFDTPYTTGALGQGAYLYLQMAEEDAAKFKEGLTVQGISKENFSKELFGRVEQVVRHGIESYIAVKVLVAIEAEGAEGVNYAVIVGTSNPQGAARPQSQNTRPEKFTNYTQIFRDPLAMTRTALQTKLRTAEQRRDARREALQAHAMRMERAFLKGYSSETIGHNNKPETTTMGAMTFVKTYAPDNVSDYKWDPAQQGNTWINGGEDWINGMIERIWAYGSTEKLGLCGSGALTGIDKLVRATGNIELRPRQVDYGLQIVEWWTAHGPLFLMSSPLMSQDVTLNNSIFIVEPEKLSYRPLQDTIFKGDVEYDNNESSDLGVDGLEEEFLTEAGLEFHFPNHMGLMHSIGVDNVVPAP